MPLFTSINEAQAASGKLREGSRTMSPSPSDEAEPNRANHKPKTVDDSLLVDTDVDDSSNRLILSIDFGTTYSSVSYIALPNNRRWRYASSNDIRSIENYPGDKNREEGNQMKKEVPTELMYPLDPNFRRKANLNRPATTSATAAESDPDDLADEPDAMDVDPGQYDIPSARPNTDDFKWGYTMHEAWANPVTHYRKTSRAMNRFKLLLDRSERTQELRNRLQSSLNYLTSQGIVENEVGVIADFLTFLLRHVKKQLQSLRLYDDYNMEMVLCVPAIWTQKACRNMQVALFTAMQSAQFKGTDLSCGAIENFFLVSEPEAAAAFTLDTDPDIHVSTPYINKNE